MRRILCFAILLLAASLPSFAIIPIGVLCPISVSNGLPLQFNYGPFFIDTVTVGPSNAQVTNFSCNEALNGYATFDLNAPSGFSINFSDSLGSTTFSNVGSTSVSDIGGADYYSTTFTATRLGNDYPNEFIGVGIVGGKSGATWTGSGSTLTFDPQGDDFHDTKGKGKSL